MSFSDTTTSEATGIAGTTTLQNYATIYDGVDYSAVYDYNYYLDKYPDLKEAFSGNDTAALAHFVTSGMSERRQAKSSFDVNSYFNQYADLRTAFGTDWKAYYLHYMKYGQNEGRAATGCTSLQGSVTIYNGVDYSAVYDYSYYLDKYPDLKQAYSGNDVAALAHFVTFGMNECRQAKSSFDVNSYYNQYVDLRTIFGTDWKSYYLHYISYGRNEGRATTGCTSLQGYVTSYNGVDYSAVYDYNYYLNSYSDLKQAFSGNDSAALAHFVSFGMNECRQANASFDVASYYSQYADLRAAYGTDWKSYYLHYIKFGKNEGRNGTGCTLLITEYSDDTGSQAMFYTIEKGNHWIIVDGGTAGNASKVRQVIASHGGSVDAWILTHPHPDHIGAFNAIYSDLQGIQIGQIYTINMDYNLYQQNAKYWDDFSTYDTFCSLTNGISNLTYLSTGDELNICGIKLKVYNAYDATTINYSTDLANEGSLVFEVFGASESMLFCADINGDAICNKIISQWGSELESTYLQVGHHGNNSVTKTFINTVKPKICFFDAPDWLINGTNYDTSENISYVKSIGADVRTYLTAPNYITVK